MDVVIMVVRCPDAAGRRRDAVIAVQARVIGVLAAEDARLAGQAARAEPLASRNSGNSSMPPSADDLPGRTPPRRKHAGGCLKRKPGKQPGGAGVEPGLE